MSNYNIDLVKIIVNDFKRATQAFYLDSKSILSKEAIEDEIAFGILPEITLKALEKYTKEVVRALIIFLSNKDSDKEYKSIFS